jgi:hypothetical protein
VSEGDETKTAEPPRPRKKKKKKKHAGAAASEPNKIAVAPRAGGAVAAPAAGGIFTPRRIVLVAAALAAIGLATVSHQPSDAGRALWIAGTLLFVVGIHMLGRLGPEGLEAHERLQPPDNPSIEPPS